MRGALGSARAWGALSTQARAETTDINSIKESRSSTDSKSAIRMDLFNSAGTTSAKAKFGRLRQALKGALANLAVKRSTTVVLSSEVVINQGLPVITK